VKHVRFEGFTAGVAGNSSLLWHDAMPTVKHLRTFRKDQAVKPGLWLFDTKGKGNKTPSPLNVSIYLRVDMVSHLRKYFYLVWGVFYGQIKHRFFRTSAATCVYFMVEKNWRFIRTSAAPYIYIYIYMFMDEYNS
jgi:hypothetical protein